ncbi:MAG: PEFG-CTERM sorting domain-containing protein [Nitrososphaerales archaeon]
MHWRAFALFMLLVVSVLSTVHSVALAEEEWKIYKITTEDDKKGGYFKIPYRITNGEVKDMMGDPVLSMLLINVETDPANNGKGELTVPRNLLDSKVFVDGRLFDVDLLVSVDGKNVENEEINTSPCFRTISFDLPAGSKQIFVSGVTAFPLQADEDESEEDEFPPIYISTDKDNYKQGELITISGCTSLELDDKNLALEVINPEGQVFKTVAITPSSDGSFLTKMTVEGELGIDGTYTARATYAGETESSTFVVPEFPLAALLAFAVAVSMITVFARTKAVKL